MQRELLLIGEMIEAAEQAQALVANIDLEALASDRQRRDALLWNFTVLGEAAAQLDETAKDRFPEIPWARPSRLRNRIIHGYWSIDLEILHTNPSGDGSITIEWERAQAPTTSTTAPAAPTGSGAAGAGVTPAVQPVRATPTFTG